MEANDLEFLAQIQAVIPAEIPIFLVGGAVRDSLLGRKIKDYDFVVPGRALELARRVADRVGGGFYSLDEGRETGRVILKKNKYERAVLDFAVQRGEDLIADLRARDFTINSMAINLRDLNTLIDPLSGAADLRAKVLRVCSDQGLSEDPLRVLRGIRLSNNFSLRIEPTTLRLMRSSAAMITLTSPERQRDEIYQILLSSKPVNAIRVAANIEALDPVFPELKHLSGVQQSFPHTEDVWNHTLTVMDKLTTVLEILQLEYDPDASGGLIAGLTAMRLSRYRHQITAHLSSHLNKQRPERGLLFLAALYHDAGKPEVKELDAAGRIRFFNHEQVGARIITQRAKELHFSNNEIERLELVIRHHMRPIWLGQQPSGPSRKAIYRFFREVGPAGIDICLLTLADFWGTYKFTLDQEHWQRHLDVVRSLCAAWWEAPAEQVSPPPLINGSDLLEKFRLRPGPIVGQILELIREGQVSGEVTDRQKAFDLARRILDEQYETNSDFED